MRDRAYIQVTTHELPRNRSYRTYSWIGDPRAEIIIDTRDCPLSELPWRLVKIEDKPECDGGLYVRADGWLFLNAYATKAVEITHRLYRGLRARIVLTCHIWGIGYTEHYEEPVFANLFKPNPWRKW